MLRSLLSPLIGPSPSQQSFVIEEQVEATPEDFARDVLVEVMRNSVERLKVAEGLSSRTEELTEIHKIMLEDACTKDVFREMDGFLVLMNILSTIQPSHSWPIAEPGDQIVTDVLEATRLIFAILDESLYQHELNTTFFERSVGYESLCQAIRPLLSDLKTTDQTLGFLLSLAMHNFALSSVFQALSTSTESLKDYSDMDRHIETLEPMLHHDTIRYPGALRVLFSSIPDLPTGPNESGSMRRYFVYKLFERLCSRSHRNHAVTGSLDLVAPLFNAFCPSTSSDEKGGNITALPKPERQVLLRLLKKLLELGCSSDDARVMFQRALVPKQSDTVGDDSAPHQEDALNGDVLEVLRAGVKARWPQHFSFRGPSGVKVLVPTLDKTLSKTGFTFMLWLWIEQYPIQIQDIATLRFSRPGSPISTPAFTLRIQPDGFLMQLCPDSPETAALKARVQKGRWTHLTVIAQPHGSRADKYGAVLFVNGDMTDSLNITYPKIEVASKDAFVLVGDTSEEATMPWCFASAYLLATPIGDSIPRFIRHLSPRYTAHFRAGPELVKFMTYESATSLSIHIANVNDTLTALGPSPDKSHKKKALEELMTAVKNGLTLGEDDVIVCLTPGGHNEPRPGIANVEDVEDANLKKVSVEGDVFEVVTTPLDLSMWKLGGAAVALGLLQYANTAHELSRTLSILTGGLKNSWQNSDDMERIRGYEILAGILRSKPQLINMTGFETLSEFLGMNFRSPDQSTITNPSAYRYLALDFLLWSRTRPEIQRVHLAHFITLLATSSYQKFNASQLVASKHNMGLLRKLLFVLQTVWYDMEMVKDIVQILRELILKKWNRDDTVKPLIAYLAANLHEIDGTTGTASPGSMISHISPHAISQRKASQVLAMLVLVLYSSPSHYTKLTTYLPLPRIYLLLLGTHPTPFDASRVLRLIQLSLSSTSSFGRKFELVSGWSVLRIVLPDAWDEEVRIACFDLLFGRQWAEVTKGKGTEDESTIVACPNIVPAIFSALQVRLDILGVGRSRNAEEAASHAERLLDELMQVHSASSTFRQVFKSQSTTAYFLDAYKSFVAALRNSTSLLDQATIRILEKMSHLGLSIALDTVVAAEQKSEVLDLLQLAETVLSPDPAHDATIDPTVIVPKRPRRSRFASSRFSIHIGEKTVRRTMTRIEEWRKTVFTTERKRLRQTVLDLREEHRQVAGHTEWRSLLTDERGIWPTHAGEPKWRLDETEGPYRIRMRLERDLETIINSKIDLSHSQDRIYGPDLDNQSVVHTEVPPWAESYDIAADSEDRQLDDEVREDKHRRIRHELEADDVIEAVTTVARISGVDSYPGLLIFGRTHLYMFDGVVQNHEGEVIDANEAPKELFFVPGSTPELNGPQTAQRWKYDQILNYSDRTFLFRDVALEIYFRDSRSLLVVFPKKAERQATNERLHNAISGRHPSDSLTPGYLKSPLVNRLSARVSATARASAKALMGFRLDELSTAQRRWQAREISNYAYISILNQLSGRTPSDATQYPVFPWVISDYTSTTLNLKSNSTFRDLTKPMGALSPARREAAETRYKNLQSVDEVPFHYGTHFSSSMIVCHFLIRLAPFTNMFKTLQGGDWDLPDRLFVDMQRAYESASQDLRGDVRELIPEFYTCPEFLENSANLDFGIQQNNGERIHDVKLPPWAKNDPLLFIILNREALEGDYVSHNLPAWIDLIWGCKQRDPEALNVFHPLSYEGAVDIESITDPLEREATVGIIHNFGQTPRKLFNSPHPDRMMHGCSTLPIGTIYGISEDFHLLSQGSKVIRDLGQGNAIHELVVDNIGERVIPCTQGRLVVPSAPHEAVEWDIGRTSPGDLRVLSDRKIVQVVESAFCLCATFADPDTLVTGSLDYTVRLWQLSRGSGVSNTPRYGECPLKVIPTHLMRSHRAPVTSVAASRTWALVVSGSEDGSLAFWDLNRGNYVRSIWHGQGREWAIHLAAINESTGNIASCSRDRLWLHTINGRPIASLDLTGLSASPAYPPIASLAFHEREYSRQPVIATGGPDGAITLRTWNANNTPEGAKARWEFATLRTLKVKTADGERMPRRSVPCVTALRFVGELLYHGEDSGKVFCWELPD
ncbi:unnamed protein product [Somion occarium]|uniref:Beach-domain-containing protein n=1 Tax=Somion occarium TaxID=3059160 RepID=A0ABP1DWJ8_9APHY